MYTHTSSSIYYNRHNVSTSWFVIRTVHEATGIDVTMRVGVHTGHVISGVLVCISGSLLYGLMM